MPDCLDKQVNAKLLWGNLIHSTNSTIVGAKFVLQLSEIAQKSIIFSVPIKDCQFEKCKLLTKACELFFIIL